MEKVIVITKEEFFNALDQRFKTINNQLSERFKLKEKNQLEYLSRKETAKLLKVSLVTLNDWSKRGLVKPYYMGKRVLYKKEEIINSVEKVNIK